MKKKILIIKATVLFFLLSVVTISVNADPSIIITDYEIYPSELMPGDKGLLTLTIANTEIQASTTETSGDVSNSITITENIGVVIENIRINPAYDSNGNKIESTVGHGGYNDLGNIAPGTSFQVSFEIVADENISKGYYFPYVKIDLKNDENGNYEDVTFPIKLKVSNNSINLIPSNFPSKISMSGATDIFFSVINTRENTVEKLIVTPNIIKGIEIKPEKVFIESINSGSSKDVCFSLIPCEIGKKNLTFDIIYNNGENVHISSSIVVVDIIDTLDVSPIIYNIPSKIEVGEKESIRLKIYNSKTEDIASVIVTPISDVRISPSQYFIGSMESDDIYSISFDMDTTGLKVNQTYEIGFSVSFKQDGTTFKTPVVMTSFTSVSNNGNGDELAISIGVLITILIIGGVLTYRWRKKLRMKKSASK